MSGRIVRAVAKSKHSWMMSGVVILAFALRVAGLDFQSLWRDEVDAVRFATRAWDQVFGMFLEPGQNGPLYYLMLRPWLHIAGESEYALRFFSVVFGTLAVGLVYRLARRLFPSLPFLALVAALLTATSPYLDHERHDHAGAHAHSRHRQRRDRDGHTLVQPLVRRRCLRTRACPR